MASHATPSPALSMQQLLREQLERERGSACLLCQRSLTPPAVPRPQVCTRCGRPALSD